MRATPIFCGRWEYFGRGSRSECESRVGERAAIAEDAADRGRPAAAVELRRAEEQLARGARHVGDGDRELDAEAFVELLEGDVGVAVLVDEPATPAQLDALIAAADCFVSLHRGEGLGLHLAAALWLGGAPTPARATAVATRLRERNCRNA